MDSVLYYSQHSYTAPYPNKSLTFSVHTYPHKPFYHVSDKIWLLVYRYEFEIKRQKIYFYLCTFILHEPLIGNIIVEICNSVCDLLRCITSNFSYPNNLLIHVSTKWAHDGVIYNSLYNHVQKRSFDELLTKKSIKIKELVTNQKLSTMY